MQTSVLRIRQNNCFAVYLISCSKYCGSVQYGLFYKNQDINICLQSFSVKLQNDSLQHFGCSGLFFAFGKKYHFCRGQTTFFLIAVQTAYYHVSTGTAAAADNRNYVVYRKLFFRKLFSAITADAFAEQLLKIRRAFQLSCFVPLAFDMLLVAENFHIIIKHFF